MYLLAVFFPLFGSLIAGFGGRWIGNYGAGFITTACLASSFFLNCIIFYEVGLSGRVCHFQLSPWIESEMFVAAWGFLFDSLTAVMLIVVTSISSLVHLYSTCYMENDPHLPRFMSYLSLFTFFMLILVTADNFLQMFLGWEGIGLASYLLINFWFGRLQANKAAIKAMVVNRVGDFGLALGIFGVFYQFKALDYATVFAIAPAVRANPLEIRFLSNIIRESFSLDLVCLLLFVGAVGKSAQLGLHTWLPDAMEGPTPVRALIHAATLVTAGVFLICRCSPLFEHAPIALAVVTFFGGITAFFAATTGLVQNDLKRVIAYSTCSQLGYMVFACGLSSYSVGVFHLANHAFFKALLFLRAGSVIHAMNDEQDMRKMGGLVRILPFTYAMMFIGSLSLMGFPFMTGFYSKDVILEVAYARCTIHGHFAHWLGTLAAFFTAFYSMRLLYLTFLGESNSYKPVMNGAHESPFAMSFPLFILSFGAIFIGYLSRDIIIGLGTDFWGNALYVAPENSIIIDSEFIPHSVKLTPVIFSISGAIASFIIYSDKTLWSIGFNFKESHEHSMIPNQKVRAIYTFLNRKWFFDKVYNEWLNQPVLTLGHWVTYRNLDRGLIEILGPFGLSNLLYNTSRQIVKLQTGLIYHYAFMMLIAVTLAVLFIGLGDTFFQYVDLRILFTLLFSIVVMNSLPKSGD
jgi:proton-translocating NADH-quinone oxidoreductase chain L